ncbi:unnamed protein product [Caenorhabditis bovis]|uniref:Piwi domain-containing protein n=1 Tax=Caenorhabditis bovis TaxID=2654633 RepID=A0A8S1EFS5_9PELO|nr:unnamed protein product [Caenorhabditis bovis]
MSRGERIRDDFSETSSLHPDEMPASRRRDGPPSGYDPRSSGHHHRRPSRGSDDETRSHRSASDYEVLSYLSSRGSRQTSPRAARQSDSRESFDSGWSRGASSYDDDVSMRRRESRQDEAPRQRRYDYPEPELQCSRRRGSGFAFHGPPGGYDPKSYRHHKYEPRSRPAGRGRGAYRRPREDESRQCRSPVFEEDDDDGRPRVPAPRLFARSQSDRKAADDLGKQMSGCSLESKKYAPIEKIEFCERPEKMIQDTTLGKKTVVQTNYIRVHTSSELILLYVYNVTVTKFGKRHEKVLKKRQEIVPIFWKCVEQNRGVFPQYQDMLFNDNNMLWTKSRIRADDYETQHFVYDNDGRKIGVVTLMFVSVSNYTANPQNAEEAHQMVQLIDLIVTARNRCRLTNDSSYFYTHGKNTFIVSGNLGENEFSMPMSFYVGDSIEGWRGMHFAVKPCLRGGILANIDLISSTFCVSQYPILQLIIEQAFGKREAADPEIMAKLSQYGMSSKNRKNVTRILGGRKLRLTYRNKSFKFGKLTDEPASLLFFVADDNRRISIADYFESIGMKLRYPNLPCVVPSGPCKKNRVKPIYPMEFLTTSSAIEKFSGPLTEKLAASYIKHSVLPPQKRLTLIQEMTNKECTFEKMRTRETQATRDRKVVMEINKKMLADGQTGEEVAGMDSEGPSLDNQESSSKGTTEINEGSPVDISGPSTSAKKSCGNSDNDMGVDESAATSDEIPTSDFPKFLDNDDIWMTNFATGVEKSFLTAKATILPVPSLIFGNSRFYDASHRGDWSIGREHPCRRIKMVATKGTKTKVIVPAILVVQNPNDPTCQVDDGNLTRHQAKMLLNRLNDHGQPVYYANGEPNIICATTFNQSSQQIIHLQEFLYFFREKVAEMVTDDKIGVPFLLCIYAYKGKNYNSQRDQFPPDYAIIKSLCDCEIGIYNQGILYETYRTLDDDSQNGTINNLVRKMLAKVGAVQYVLEHGGNHKNWTRLTDPSSPTLVMGIDVCHPSAEDRQNNQSLDSLSVASIVSNIDVEISQFRDSSRVQNPGDEMVVDMVHEMKMRILDFIKHSNTLMAHIVIYRDGVAESMFEKIFAEEKEALDAAIRQLRPFHKDLNPTITYIMATKRHHTRFFAIKEEDTAGPVGNVKPGTLVEDVITSSRYFDFFLTSQLGNLGTSKPVHYYVLYDDWKPSYAFWQTITHALSYNYASCPNTISLPAPLMYAHVAAKKAKSRAVGSRVIQRRNKVDSFNIRLSSLKMETNEDIDGMIFL